MISFNDLLEECPQNIDYGVYNRALMKSANIADLEGRTTEAKYYRYKIHNEEVLNMFTYLIEIKDKQTDEVIQSKEFTEDITFKQTLSGVQWEERFYNRSQLLFIQRVKEENDPTVISEMEVFLQNFNLDTVNIKIFIKDSNKNNHLIKEYNSPLSKIELILTGIEDIKYPLRYILTLGE